MIDSHCHLADAKFQQDITAVLDRAATAGVDRMIVIADTLDEGEDGLKLAEKYEQLFCTIGVHPHAARHWQSTDLNRLRQLLRASPKVVALGEIGLDYHYDNSPRDVQQAVFRLQLELAKEMALPAVVHNRESIADLKEIISDVQPEKLVIHCCTERWEDVADLVERGYLLSFTGIATYPKSDEIRRTIAECPLEQIMIETDAPYLAPVPHRGQRNEPAYVVEVAQCIADIKQVSLEQVDRQTVQNTEQFFSLV